MCEPVTILGVDTAIRKTGYAVLRLTASEPADTLAELLGEAREAILRLLGERLSPDEILSTVFRTFCIGK